MSALFEFGWMIGIHCWGNSGWIYVPRKMNHIADADTDVFLFLFILFCVVSYSVFVLGKQMDCQYKKITKRFQRHSGLHYIFESAQSSNFMKLP